MESKNLRDMFNCVLKLVKQRNCPDSNGAEEMKNLSAYCVCSHVLACVCVCTRACMQVRVEAPMLGERGVFFSILWGLRQGEREAEHWEVQQLNSVHCNRTRAGRSRSPAFLQSAVYTHDCRCAMGRWEGG